MITHTDRSVTLGVVEEQVRQEWHDRLSEGGSITATSTGTLEWALSTIPLLRRGAGGLTAEFVEWLTEGTVIVTRGRRVVPTAKGRMYP